MVTLDHSLNLNLIRNVEFELKVEGFLLKGESLNRKFGLYPPFQSLFWEIIIYCEFALVGIFNFYKGFWKKFGE